MDNNTVNKGIFMGFFTSRREAMWMNHLWGSPKFWFNLTHSLEEIILNIFLNSCKHVFDSYI